MKAIVVRAGKASLEEVELKEELGRGMVRVRTLYNGICGTDRGIVSGSLKFSRPPQGFDYLVLGHETLGEVQEVGEGVNLRKGDLVVPVVRRGCGECLNCLVGRQDFCETGKFTEIGIRGAHGTMRETFVDYAENLVVLPRELGEYGVLLEPLSNVVKAVREVEYLQGRSLWRCRNSTYSCRDAAIIGSGPIGLLFSMALKTMGFNVYVLNRRPPSEVEKDITEAVGARFVDTTKEVAPLPGPDLLVDTSGHPSAFVPLLDRIKKNGAVILFGTTGKEREEITAEQVTELVENNVLLVGSVNASKEDFREGGNLLTLWKEEYPDVLGKMITHKVSPGEAVNALSGKLKGEIKTVVDWSNG